MEPTESLEIKPEPNKKIFIVSIIALVVLFIISLLIVISSRSNKADTAKEVSQQIPGTPSQQIMQEANPTKVINSNTPGNWNIYKNSIFSINYPRDWKAEEVKLASGGIEAKIVPVIKNPAKPSIFVIADSISAVPSIRQKEQAYLNLGFESSVSTLSNIQANKLIGTLPPVNKLGTASANIKVLQTTHLFFDKGIYSYLVTYSYFGKVKDPQYENTFSNIVASFKLLQ